MRTIEMHSGVVRLIDQRKLPRQLEIVECRDYRTLAHAIKDMTIRGAPAIGAAAAFGLALAALESKAKTPVDLLRDLDAAEKVLRVTRPTAVNLMWALDRVMNAVRKQNLDANGLRDFVVQEAQNIAEEDVTINTAMAKHGATLIDDGDTVLTHCNAGALATVDVGTALGVIIQAHKQGKKIHVMVDETRPRLQGAKLTAWELTQAGVPMTLIADNAPDIICAKGKWKNVLSARIVWRQTAMWQIKSARKSGGTGARKWYSVLCCDADLDHRYELAQRRFDSDRGTRWARGDAHRWRTHCPGRRKRWQSSIRRNAEQVRDRDCDRARHHLSALYGKLEKDNEYSVASHQPPDVVNLTADY